MVSIVDASSEASGGAALSVASDEASDKEVETTAGKGGNLRASSTKSTPQQHDDAKVQAASSSETSPAVDEGQLLSEETETGSETTVTEKETPESKAGVHGAPPEEVLGVASPEKKKDKLQSPTLRTIQKLRQPTTCKATKAKKSLAKKA